MTIENVSNTYIRWNRLTELLEKYSDRNLRIPFGPIPIGNPFQTLILRNPVLRKKLQPNKIRQIWCVPLPHQAWSGEPDQTHRTVTCTGSEILSNRFLLRELLSFVSNSCIEISDKRGFQTLGTNTTSGISTWLYILIFFLISMCSTFHIKLAWQKPQKTTIHMYNTKLLLILCWTKLIIQSIFIKIIGAWIVMSCEKRERWQFTFTLTQKWKAL